ncbi:MAG: FMN-binding negative transcriptional regulator [Proteobacteria bacterium]|nr:FMN-binding negative transcriptional regulator [Pseudomonadota bacterium]
MYTPPYYRESGLSELDTLVAAHPFATLVTVRDGAPFVTHLPVLYARDGDRVVFRGHWARPNPQWRDADDALLIVHGPHAYVSPSWYPDNEQAARVPTWNYAVAHIHGTLEIRHDADSLAAIVSELSDRHEAANGSGWRFEPESNDHRVQLKGIVGFRMEAARIELKFKLNQNHPEANRRAVVAALAAKPDDASRAVAALMRTRLSQPTLPEDTHPTGNPA